jgi:predicted nucleotide-binding protein
MKIFIGSSSHYVTFKTVNSKSSVDIDDTRKNSKLRHIITFLESKGHEILPWWENSNLSAGKEIIESLIELAHKCDAGIFILRKDDLLMEKQSNGNDLGVPRGNVLIECGMFFGSKGKDRTFPIRDGNFEEIKIPVDIIGKLIKDIDDTNLNIDLEKFFDNEKLKIENKKTKFYLSNVHTESILKQEYKNWSSKALYIGSKSARLWKGLEDDNKSLIDKTEVKSFVSEIHSDKSINIDFTKINNVISLGPGCGKFDNEIISQVYKKNKFINYVPIDINPYLAFRACEYVKKKSPEIRIPFAIIEDFEENSQFVSEILKTKFHDLNQSCLFLMLGGTFSNLEGDEENLISKIESWMSKDDFLIIDAFIKENGYNFMDDDKRQVANLPKSYNEFIVNSIEKRHLITNEKSLKAVKSDLSKFLFATETTENKLHSVIPNTSEIAYELQIDTVKQEIFIAKIYDFENIKTFLTENFKLIHSFNGLEDGSKNKSDRGIFLLQKK